MPRVAGGASLPTSPVMIASGSGNFTVPAGWTKIRVHGWGGGRGGRGANAPFLANGAEGGDYSRKDFEVSPGQVIAYSIGAAGAGGDGPSHSFGSPGGDTTFGSLTVKGGASGTTSSGHDYNVSSTTSTFGQGSQFIAPAADGTSSLTGIVAPASEKQHARMSGCSGGGAGANNTCTGGDGSPGLLLIERIG